MHSLVARGRFSEPFVALSNSRWQVSSPIWDPEPAMLNRSLAPLATTPPGYRIVRKRLVLIKVVSSKRNSALVIKLTRANQKYK